MHSIVSVLKTSPDSIQNDYADLMNQVGIRSVLNRTEPTAVLAEVGLDSFYPAATPPPWLLDGVIRAFNLAYDSQGKIELLVRGLTGFLNRRDIARHFGRLNGECVVSDLRDFAKDPSSAIKGKNVIVLGTMRTHASATLCGALVNAALAFRPSGQFRPVLIGPGEVCERYRRLKSISSGVFGVLDGTFSGDGAGPRCLRIFTKNFILASSDLVALDAVAAKMMGYDPISVPYLRKAQEEGLGCADFERIQISGADISTVDFRFHVTAEESSTVFGELIRRLRLNEDKHKRRYRLLVSLIERTQDFYVRKNWFGKVGKKRRALAARTLWGKLLKDYGLEYSGSSLG